MRRAVAALLSRYGCADEVRRLETLAAYERPLRVCVLRAETAQGRFVVKLLARQAVSQTQEERQAAFSEFLRAQDLPVPQKFRAGDNFCSVLRLGREVYLATVEEDFGEDLRRPTPETVYALGRFLGRMHSASLAAGFQLADGHTWRALMAGRTTAAQIWQGTPPLPEFAALCQRHDAVCATMRRLWPQLAHSLNGAYCHRLIAALWQAAHREEACALLPHALRQYECVAPDFDLTEVLSHACIQ